MRACMIHLEEKGILKNKFGSKFRTHKVWDDIDHSKPWEMTQEVKETYADKGQVEPHNVYEKYRVVDNYGTAKKEDVEKQEQAQKDAKTYNPLID